MTYKEMKEELFKKHGVENNPKSELAWSLSWEHAGHSVDEQENLFSDLVDLIK